jgi:hypothetical protein
MKPLKILSLFALCLPLSALSACPPGMPKINGLDYHTARAKLIKAGFIPVLNASKYDGNAPTSPDAAALGYFESMFPGNASRRFLWQTKGQQFEISVYECEELSDTRAPCRVYAPHCPAATTPP